ncbi:transposase [Mesorhizobium sp.]|uniref:transposase n=1 Tax=Mesorhizobium sp. TaxID=1871066 RepID=UPI003443B615
MTLSIPRDRAGAFDPKLIAKYQRRYPDFDDKIISMYARGMSVREIRGHLEELYGIDVSPDLISAVTDAILEGVAESEQAARRGLSARLLRRDPGPGTRASCASKPSTSRSAFYPTATRRFWASGSSSPKAPSSGCA